MINVPLAAALLGSANPAIPAEPSLPLVAEAAVQTAPPPSEETAAGPDEIVVSARQDVPEDPGQAINVEAFKAVTAVDNALVAPLAMGYKKVLPSPARTGLRNVLRNLTEPVNFLNFMLQLKPGKAAETVGRFAVNSTVGVAGLIDVAKSKSINLPYRPNGFGNTFGYYGVGAGPYMFLPVIGPTSARDLVGWVLDKSFLPSVAGAPFNTSPYALGTGVVKSLDDRIELDDKFKEFHATGDPYVAEREWYLAKRRDEIEALHGRGPLADAKKKQPEAKAAPGS
ncbi:VacJ family lipoprotein [Novosphingobium sp.]|uniref:MlaA family lipoprotein n=1 Tax=Novosphingobium sp. TaxID=1874826 RepID=UPI00286DB288|nr:VacJ family lipoprotein [Novosphingobium sp.]